MSVPTAFAMLTVSAVTLAASSAFAQEGARRPNRALFGSGSSDLEQSLTVNGSGGAGYDSDVRQNASEAGFNAPARGSDGSAYSLLSGGLHYSVNKRTFDIGMTGSASRRFYTSSSQSALSSYNGGIGASFTPSTRTRFGFNQTFTYQPFSLYSLFPQADPEPLGEPLAPDLDYYTTTQGYLSQYTSATFSRQLSRRATFSAEYTRQASDVPNGLGDFVLQTGLVRFTRSFKPGLALRLGYGYTAATYANLPDRQGYHTFDTGVDYSRTLGPSRRTTFSFGTGATAINRPGDTDFTVIGNADLRREIGRTWNFTVGYRRDVQFLETFGGPLEYQSLNAQLHGLITRRFSFHSGVGATTGRFTNVAGVSSDGFDDIYTSTGVGTALNRYLNLSVDYSFYWYGAGRVIVIPGGLDSEKGRHAIRASIDAWAPLFERGRRRNAAR